MDIEIKVDANFTKPKIVVYTNEINEQISNIIDSISSINNGKLMAYKDETMFILDQKEIETIYSENGKVYIRCNNELYIIKHRLYELESILDKKLFVRISNSEIVNFNDVKNIDCSIIGTMILNFKSGNKTYASRRYIPKIKEFLEL